jgi:hypothetical protein
MNAPVQVPRPEVSDPLGTAPTTGAPDPRLGWPSIILLIVAALVTMLWNAALAWLVGRAFGVW